MPSIICLPCKSKLKLLCDFKNDCLKSEKLQKLKSIECVFIKTEEIMLDDVDFEDENGTNSLVLYKDIELESNIREESDSLVKYLL